MGNTENAMLKQQLISCRLIVYVSLVSRRNLLSFVICKNMNFEHHSQDIIYLPGQKPRGASIRKSAPIQINVVYEF